MRLLLFLPLVVFLAACSKSDPQVKLKTLLATYSVPDRSDTFTLWATGLYDHATHMEQESCTVSDLRLVVIRDKLTGPVKWRPLEISYHSNLSYQGFGAPPLWDRRYIPLGKFSLPSGEFYVDEGNQLYCIIVDDTVRAFRLDNATETFVPINAIPHSPAFTRFYAQAFKINDVYWSYALTSRPEFFLDRPLPPRPLSSPGFAAIEDIYPDWRAQSAATK